MKKLLVSLMLGSMMLACEGAPETNHRKEQLNSSSKSDENEPEFEIAHTGNGKGRPNPREVSPPIADVPPAETPDPPAAPTPILREVPPPRTPPQLPPFYNEISDQSGLTPLGGGAGLGDTQGENISSATTLTPIMGD